MKSINLRALNLPILVALLAVGVLAAGCKTQQQQAADILTNEDPIVEDGGGVVEDGDSSELQRFIITGKNFSFSETEMRVKKGDRVRVQLTSEDGYHDWVVDEFNAATGRVNTGETTAVEFTVDQVGEFEYYCSVGQHREFGMVGKLIVEE